MAYATANGTATAGSDYTAASGTLTLLAGDDDADDQRHACSATRSTRPTRRSLVNLSNPVNAAIATAQGVGTIVDNDPAPSIAIGNVSVTEGNSGNEDGSLTVTLSAPSGLTVTVNYATANGTATAGSTTWPRPER